MRFTDLSLAEENESRVVLQVGVRDDVVDLSSDTVHLVVLAAQTDELGITDDLSARGRGLRAGDHILWKAGKQHRRRRSESERLKHMQMIARDYASPLLSAFADHSSR